MGSIFRNTIELFTAPIFTEYSVIWIALAVTLIAFSPIGKYVFKAIKALINSIALFPAILSGFVGGTGIYRIW